VQEILRHDGLEEYEVGRMDWSVPTPSFIIVYNTDSTDSLIGYCTELDNHYPRFHADKARRITERGEKCCKTAPEAMDGAIELLEELYALPSQFYKKADGD
jgi:hypothetical protein